MPEQPQPAAVEPPVAQLSAILLAGGRGSRMGGVEKALLRRDGQPQIERWLQELEVREVHAVVVGPPSLRPHIQTAVPLVRETPQFAGPAAGVLAGVAELRRRWGDTTLDRDSHPDLAADGAPSGWTLLLAVDLAEPAPLLDWLLGHLDGPGNSKRSDATVGAVPAAVLPYDQSGRQQHLSAAVPTGWLLHRVGQLTPGEVEHRPLRWLLRGLDDAVEVRSPVVPRGLSDDADTLHDAHRLGLRLP